MLVLAVVTALVVQAVIAAVVLPSAPEEMAIHWGPSGRADGFARPWVALSVTPVLSVVVGAVLAAAPLLDPRVRADLPTSRAYDRVVLGVVVLLTLVQAMLAFQWEAGRILPVVMGVGAALLGRSLRAVRPNTIIGFRVPWTLASDLAWERTHARLARWWTWAGVGTVVAAIVHPAAGLGVLLASLLGSTVVLTMLSRRWWAEDPARRPL